MCFHPIFLSSVLSFLRLIAGRLWELIPWGPPNLVNYSDQRLIAAGNTTTFGDAETFKPACFSEKTNRAFSHGNLWNQKLLRLNKFPLRDLARIGTPALRSYEVSQKRSNEVKEQPNLFSSVNLRISDYWKCTGCFHWICWQRCLSKNREFLNLCQFLCLHLAAKSSFAAISLYLTILPLSFRWCSQYGSHTFLAFGAVFLFWYTFTGTMVVHKLNQNLKLLLPDVFL